MNKQFLTTIHTNQLIPLLTQAETELKKMLADLDAGLPPNNFHLSPANNRMLNFNEQFQAHLLASKTLGNEELIKAHARDEIGANLAQIMILRDYLKQNPNNKLTFADIVLVETTYQKRLKINGDFNLLNLSLQNSEITIMPKDPSVTQAQKLIPLGSLKTKTSDQIVQIIVRAVPVQEEVENDLNSVLSFFVRNVHNEASMKPLIPKIMTPGNIDRLANVIANTIAIREAVAGSFAPLLKKMTAKKPIPLWDEDYHKAYNAVLTHVRGQYAQFLTQNPNQKPEKSAPPPPYEIPPKTIKQTVPVTTPASTQAAKTPSEPIQPVDQQPTAPANRSVGKSSPAQPKPIQPIDLE